MKRRRNTYLYQLVITSSFLVIIPTLFFFVFFFEKSYDEIVKNNTEYYENIARSFCGSVVNEISELNRHAVTFSVNSKRGESNAGIFYDGTSHMMENEYYYWEAAQELYEYGKKGGLDSFGVCYYDADVILYENKKFTIKRFIEDYLKIGSNNLHVDDVKKFFSADSFKRSKNLFVPICLEDGTYESMLVGTCVRLGKSNEMALCFSVMKPQDLDFFYQSVQGRPWESYYVLDGNTGAFLYGLGNLNEEVIKYGIQSDSLKAYSEQTEDEIKSIFCINNKKFEIMVVVDASDNMEQNSIAQFYSEMRTFIVYILLVMVAVWLAAIYLNYRPIHRLLKKIQGDGQNEFEIIFNELENQGTRLTEQRMMIMDLLMNHLLYGLPISENYISKLGIDDELKCYGVLLISDYVLDSAETEYLMKEAEREFKTLLFVTDMQGEKSTVLIAFMPDDNMSAIRGWITEWCKSYIKCQHMVSAGSTVNQINDIRKSLDVCRKQMASFKKAEEKRKTASAGSDGAVSYEKLKDEIIVYLEENYWNRDLSQTLVADYFHISVYSLSRMFKKQFDMGFSEYVNIKRLEKAKELLINTDKTIKEISAEVGFTEPNYFSRLFRQNFENSPTEFREKNV